jgi:thiol:disulfide interchange protein DsbD
VARGSAVTLALKVHLPAGIHVQADKPRDPLLIATTLTLTPPEGVTVERIVFPAGTDFVQAGQGKPLLVFESDFVVEARVRVTASAPDGDIRIPAVLRYQACNDRVCFAPVRAPAAWTITAGR